MQIKDTRKKNKQGSRRSRKQKQKRITAGSAVTPSIRLSERSTFNDIQKYDANSDSDNFKQFLIDFCKVDFNKIDNNNIVKNKLLTEVIRKITTVDFNKTLDDLFIGAADGDDKKSLKKILEDNTSGTNPAAGPAAGPTAAAHTAAARAVTNPTGVRPPPTSGGGIEFHRFNPIQSKIDLKIFYNDNTLGAGKELKFKNNNADLFTNPDDFGNLFTKIGNGLKILFPKDHETKGKSSTINELFTSDDDDGNYASQLINGIYYWAVTNETDTIPLSQFFTIDILDDTFGIRIKAQNKVNDDSGPENYEDADTWFEALKNKAGVNPPNTEIKIKVHAVPRSLFSGEKEGGYIGKDDPRPLEETAIPEHKYAHVFKIKDSIETFKDYDANDLEDFSKIVNKLKRFEISFKIKPNTS